MKKVLMVWAMTVGMAVGCMACGRTEPAGEVNAEEEVSAEKEDMEDGEDLEIMEEEAPDAEGTELEIEEEMEENEERISGAQPDRAPKQVVVYFANWNLNEKEAAKGGEVASIPWDSVSYINHAFWAAAPADGTTETSFERRERGAEARTEFRIVSTSAETDYGDDGQSAVDPSMKRNHFAQYAEYSEKYPDVNIMISVGGWTACGYFSEMAYTAEGRGSFIQSCMDLMDKYPWIDGIDLDWEHPGGSNDGERLPEGEGDQGCPIWGTKQEDAADFAALVKEMREAFTEKYGEGVKKITACASASYAWTLPNQDWVSAEPYLDMINIMTYDLAGDWDGITGHASGLDGVKGALGYFIGKNIPASKLNIGSPLYGTGFIIGGQLDPSKIVGAPIVPSYIDKGSLTVDVMKACEEEAVSGYHIERKENKPVVGESWDNSEEGSVCGWHYAYDSSAGAAYMYNDDEASECYKWYISYENPVSLQEKLDLIEKLDLAGIIVWECSEDTEDHQMIRQMGDFLLK